MLTKALLLVVNILSCYGYKSEITLDDHPSLWPGHLEPIGSKQKTVNVEEITEWPSPNDFFENYVDKSRPVLLKGLAKRSAAHNLWEDKYLLERALAEKEEVVVESAKKENRTNPPREMLFSEFLQIYKKEKCYMVHSVPKCIQKDVLMPSPLRCEDSRKYMEDAVTWFSSGGTKSVLHHDDLDNINCLYRGTKELLFIEPLKNEKYVPFDKPGYSDVDVDKVDFVKYPEFRKIDQYVKASMEEGDCLFIPYAWYHQVNSKANSKGQNIAVNVWFKHVNQHRPKDCIISPYSATLDIYEFKQHKKEVTEEADSLATHYETYLRRTKKNRANFKTFASIYYRDPSITERDITNIEFPKQFHRLLKQMFLVLDVTGNSYIEPDDFVVVKENEETYTKFMESLAGSHEKLLVFLDNFLFYHKDRPIDEL